MIMKPNDVEEIRAQQEQVLSRITLPIFSKYVGGWLILIERPGSPTNRGATQRRVESSKV